jgi:drug/metabolite transporter (DMT)-like permease
MLKQNHNLLYILLFFGMIGWGASWVNAKVLSAYIDAYDMIFMRFGITAITMIPIIVFLKKSFKIDLKSFGVAFLASLTFIAYMKYYFMGTKYGTASLGGAFVTTLVPIVTFLILAILGEKKMKKKDYFALLLGAIGVMTMLNIWNESLKDILVIQNLYFLLASFLWPIFTIISSKSKKISPIVFSFYLYIITITLDAVFLVDFKAISYGSFDGIFWINLLGLSLISSTFSNTVYFVGIERLGAGNVSSFIFLVPFSAIILSAIFLGENISFSIIIGTILTIYAVKILNNIKIFR